MIFRGAALFFTPADTHAHTDSKVLISWGNTVAAAVVENPSAQNSTAKFTIYSSVSAPPGCFACGVLFIPARVCACVLDGGSG